MKEHALEFISTQLSTLRDACEKAYPDETVILAVYVCPRTDNEASEVFQVNAFATTWRDADAARASFYWAGRMNNWIDEENEKDNKPY